jgi:hypothetical protein
LVDLRLFEGVAQLREFLIGIQGCALPFDLQSRQRRLLLR